MFFGISISTGPGRPLVRDVEGFLHDARDVVDVGDQIAVLHDRQRHAEEIGFLEGAFADHRLRHLAGDGDQRDGIHVGIGDAGDEIGGAGTAGGHANAGFAGGAGVTFRREGTALLVAGKDGADLGAGERSGEIPCWRRRDRRKCVRLLRARGLHEDIATLHAWTEFAA